MNTGKPGFADPATEKSNSQLVGLCLLAMGLGFSTMPEAAGTNGVLKMDAFPAPRDIEWVGMHAPTELKKILDATHHVFCVKADGTVTIEMMGEGNLPNAPDGQLLHDLPLPGIDRRGDKYVVFSSFPNPVLETVDLIGPTAKGKTYPKPGVHYVAPNILGKWGPIEDTDLLGPVVSARYEEFHVAEGAVRDGFQFGPKYNWTWPGGVSFNRPESPHLDLAKATFFHEIQSDEDRPLLRKVFEPQSPGQPVSTADQWVVRDIQVWAKIMRRRPEGYWSNDTDLLPCNVLMQSGGTRITVEELLGKLGTSQGASDPSMGFADSIRLQYFRPLDYGDLRVRVTREGWVGGSPEYFEIGFRAEAGQSIKLTPDELRLARSHGA